jgi:predicted Fe-S protein YdhL (DUF1289 family)
MQQPALLATTALVLVLAGLAPSAGLSRDEPRFWSVTGVAGNDVLHLRDVPSAESRSLARIPHDARGLKHLGCRRNQPAMELWVRMSAQQKREALTQWCRVEYRGMQGWVAGRYLRPDGGPQK